MILDGTLGPTSRRLYAVLLALPDDRDLRDAAAALVGVDSPDDLDPYLEELAGAGLTETGTRGRTVRQLFLDSDVRPARAAAWSLSAPLSGGAFARLEGGAMGDGERETWTTDEFGLSHAGAVGVLLADGTVPPPVYFDMSSGGGGRSVSQWNVYDGRVGQAPRAAALRAVCSCGWTGPEQRLDWEQIGDQELQDAGARAADTCMQDWDGHTAEVERSAVPLPESFTALVSQLESQIETLAKSSPLAAVRAARCLEVIAMQTAYWPAHEARKDAQPEQAAAALGLDERAARQLLARFGRSGPYR